MASLSSNNNTTLPAEILCRIFDSISTTDGGGSKTQSMLAGKSWYNAVSRIFDSTAFGGGNSKTEFTLVCRSWYHAATNHYGRFALSEDTLSPLKKFLLKYPAVQSKGRSLRVSYGGYESSGGERSTSLLAILSWCSNLVELRLNVCNIVPYLEVMNRPIARLPKLHYFHLSDRHYMYQSVKRLYIKIVVKMRHSLKNLELSVDNEVIKILCVEKNMNSINDLINSIPNLQHVRVWQRRFDFNDLQFLNFHNSGSTTRLKSFSLEQSWDKYLQRNLKDLDGPATTKIDTAPYDSLKNLELTINRIDIPFIENIVKKFRMLQELKIQAYDVLVVEDSIVSQKRRVKKAMKCLLNFCKGMNGPVSVTFGYCGRSYEIRNTADGKLDFRCSISH